MQTFFKVCMSLQSLRLENFSQTFCRLFFHEMHTFCRLSLWINYFHEHFLHTFCTFSAAYYSRSADFMHTYPVVADFLQIICYLFAENMFPFTDFMHTYSRHDADLMQIESVHCRILTHCAEQISVIQMPLLDRGGPPVGARPFAMPRPFAL